jgi:hypothetical protein
MSLDIKRKEIELMRVETARKELEFKIEERLDEIKRIEDHISIQLQKEEEIKKEIQNLKR